MRIRRKSFFMPLWVLFLFITPSIGSEVFFDDGLSHNIEGIYNLIMLDYNTANDPGTHIFINGNGEYAYINSYNYGSITLADGKVGTFQLYDHSSVTVIGGKVGHIDVHGNSNATICGGDAGIDLSAYDTSSAVFEAGTIANIKAYNNSNITMTGGTVKAMLFAIDNSTLTISGGKSSLQLAVGNNGIIYLDGYNFKKGDIALSYGDHISNYGLNGTISGTLKDGTQLFNFFNIYNTGIYEGIADIIIIPEPTTALFFALGGVFLKKIFKPNAQHRNAKDNS